MPSYQAYSAVSWVHFLSGLRNIIPDSAVPRDITWQIDDTYFRAWGFRENENYYHYWSASLRTGASTPGTAALNTFDDAFSWSCDGVIDGEAPVTFWEIFQSMHPCVAEHVGMVTISTAYNMASTSIYQDVPTAASRWPVGSGIRVYRLTGDTPGALLCTYIPGDGGRVYHAVLGTELLAYYASHVVNVVSTKYLDTAGSLEDHLQSLATDLS